MIKERLWKSTTITGKILRAGLGILLLVASTLKLQEQSHGSDKSKLIVYASAFEFCLGSLLFVGAWSVAIRRIALLTFFVFICVACAESIRGSKSCGCFGGGVHIPPWITAVFDSLCVILLLRCKAEIRQGAVLFGLGIIRVALALAMIATGVATAAVWATHRPLVIVAQSNQNRADADPFGAPGSLVLLVPDKLAGKPFLLSAHIDIGSQLSSGHWIVLLVHHDCDECAGAVPKYQATASSTVGTKLAIIEMPPYAGPSDSAPWSTSIGLFGKLDTTRDWFATTPIAILLKDGIVQSATDGDHAATPDPIWKQVSRALAPDLIPGSRG